MPRRFAPRACLVLMLVVHQQAVESSVSRSAAPPSTTKWQGMRAAERLRLYREVVESGGDSKPEGESLTSMEEEEMQFEIAAAMMEVGDD